MRISTSQYYESSAANYQRNYSSVVKTSEEASDLIRVRTAADLSLIHISEPTTR